MDVELHSLIYRILQHISQIYLDAIVVITVFIVASLINVALRVEGDAFLILVSHVINHTALLNHSSLIISKNEEL